MATKRPHPDGETSANNSADGEETFSMVDILAEQNELEESASAVLGGSDDQNCTYLMGYVKRQALYACQTCARDGKGPAGICLACSLKCHENHDLVELYTKRNFRCDCGNAKFPDSFSCQLEASKTENCDNQYNQNFSGKYCTCNKPYPDPDDDVEDEMIQCCICEDWYHARHLGNKPPEEFSEMICDQCVQKHDFLHLYEKYPDTVSIDENCILKIVKKKREEDGKELSKTAAYFGKHWRSNLCECGACLSMYEERGIPFLPDEMDSVEAYERKGLDGKKSQYEKGMEELSKMDRVQQVEVMSGYHDMKSELRDYLAGFAQRGEVVTKQHITQFFENMKNKKKRKVAIPLNCR